MFVLWDAAVLGSVSAEDAASAAAAVAAGGAVMDPLAALRDTSTTAAALVQGFSFFAISTSFLGFVLGGAITSTYWFSHFPRSIPGAAYSEGHARAMYGWTSAVRDE